jgi:acetolactate synthase-1/2/3 large subunit
MQLADRERLVIATMGDGSYMFANPTACHLVAEAQRLPVLVLILNNAEWGAVRRAVNEMYPGGAAVKSNQMPLTAMTPSPDFTKVAAASRCWAERVEHGRDLPAALERALRHISSTRTQALIDIAIAQ